VGRVVVGGLDVVVVFDDGAVLEVVDELEVELDVELAVVGAVFGVVVVVVGRTNGFVSPLSEARLVVGAAVKLVQLCAAFQLWIAVAAGVPVRGWGRPETMVAGRHVAELICRPVAVTWSDPLLVSGAVLS
jgi:hypothetical protein